MEEIATPDILAGCRILVVEDEYYLADDLQRVARRLGAEVIGPAPTPEKALALLDEAARVDLAVLDIKLSGETVYDVADALAARGVPFIFATGYHPGAIPARFDQVPRWIKPVDPDELLRSLPALRGKP